MHPAFELETRVLDYVNRSLTLQQLREWLASAKGPLLGLPADHPAAELATIVELGLIEVTAQVMTESMFRRLLKKHIHGVTRVLFEGNPDLVMSGSSTVNGSVKPFSGDIGGTFTVYQSIQVGT
jgi:hypothetical protein